MALEPITRQEQIIAGKGLTPITRMEKFLKEFGGSGGGGAQPDWAANEGEPGHILNRPFGESTEVLFDQRVEFVDADGMLMNSTEFPEMFEVGKTYTVTYNGTVYKCVAIDPTGEGVGYIGNASAFGGEDTGEPFVMAAINNAVKGYIELVSMPLNGDTSATIKIEKSVIHTIDPKFLPGGGGGDSRFVVNVTLDAEYKPSFDKTYEEIMEACMAGKEVVLRQGAVVYTLSGFDELEGEATFCSSGVHTGSYIMFYSVKIKSRGYWERSALKVNCTIEWSDTNKPSPT